jgi:hypothetical protein
MDIKEQLLNQYPGMDSFFDELFSVLPINIQSLLLHRDGAAQFIEKLPKEFPSETVLEINGKKGENQRAWELIGYFYLNTNHLHEALAIFRGLFQQMLIGQNSIGKRSHKGVPLVMMHECYRRQGFPVLAKRYLMLTLCEDAITFKGVINPDSSGVYFRLVWFHGLSHEELVRYANEIYKLAEEHQEESWFPEWLLQEIDQDWITELPAPQEALIFSVNTFYVERLISRLGDGSGKNLERLAAYLLSCMPGCRTTIREQTPSTDYDIVCSIEGFDVDFRSEMGRYFVCECKDWDKPVDFSTLAKFCRVLDSTKSRFGIIFSREGITGEGATKYAEREQLKVFQDRGMVIVVIDQDDLNQIVSGANFITLLRNKYKKIRLDLSHTTS